MVKRRNPCIYALLCLTAITFAATSRAQAPPPPGPPLTTGTGPLSPEQRTDIELFARYYVRQLTTPATDARADQLVNEARNALIRVTNGPVSAWWLSTYTQILQTDLRAILDGNNAQHRVNALIVAGELACDSALDLILTQIDSRDLPTRLWAANAVAIAVRKGSDRQAVGAGGFSRALRAVGQVARTEQNPLVFRKQLLALSAVQTGMTVANQSLDVIRRERLGVVGDVLDRLAGQTDSSGHLFALYETLEQMRGEFLNLPEAQRRSLGPQLAVRCGKIFEVASAHWEAVRGQSTPDSTLLQRRYGEIIDFTEKFLAFLDGVVRGASAQPAAPRTTLQSAWTSNNRDTFDRQRLQWRDFLLSTEQYRGMN